MSKKNSGTQCQIQKCGKRCTYAIDIKFNRNGFCEEHGEQYLSAKKKSAWPQYMVILEKSFKRLKWFSVMEVI